jgi:phosphate-selective porin OprO/OprP
MKRALLLFVACATSVGAFAQTTGEGETVNQYGVTVSTFPLKPEAQNNILVFENQEKGYKFWMDNRVQVDAGTFFGMENGMMNEETMKPEMKGGVMLRRVRMALKAQVSDDWYGEVDMDMADGTFELKDAIIEYTGLKNFSFKAGNFKEDFSTNETSSSRYLSLIERPMVVGTFGPSRHVGFQTRYRAADWLRFSGGVSWQAVDNWQTRFNVEEFNKDGMGMGANYTGKVVFMPWLAENHGLHIGYNASYRNGRKTDDDYIDGDQLTGRGYMGNYFSTRNSYSVNRTKYMSTEFYGVDHDILQGVELGGFKNGFKAYGEFIWNKSVMDPTYPGITNTTPKKFYGWFVEASYLLFGGEHRYDGSQSEFTQPTRGKKWGDIEIVARYDYLNLNSEDINKGSDIRGGQGENYTLGLSFYANNNVKLMLNYQYSYNDRWAGNKGKAFVGRDANGELTKNPLAVVSNGGVRFNALQCRFQIAF